MRLLAQSALEIITGFSEGGKHSNLLLEEEKKDEDSALLDPGINKNKLILNEEESMMQPDKGFKISKREAKRRLKEEKSI